MEYLLQLAQSPKQPSEIDWDALFDFDPSPDLPQGQTSLGKRRRQSPTPATEESERWLNTAFPEMQPSHLSFTDRPIELDVLNPLIEYGCLEHPRKGHAAKLVILPKDGRVDGLIKFHMRAPMQTDLVSKAGKQQNFPWAKHRDIIMKGPEQDILRSINALPPGFGTNLNLNSADEKLWNFYLVAVCGGVTLIPNDNAYVHQIAPIAAKNQCVKHAVLALAATYILDYALSDSLKARAEFHWRRAVHLLSRELRAPDYSDPGKEDAIIAALCIFFHNEVVNIEKGDPKQLRPRWYVSAFLAEEILAKSDPMYQYAFPRNVQCNRARIQLGNKVALYNVLSATMWPFDETQKTCPFTWLLEGSERDLHKICGVTGLSPRLMHTFAQITYLSSRLYSSPQRITAQKLGKAIGRRLENFWQWSDLSEGYQTSEDLISSCEIDEEGKVCTPTKVTELVAETFAAAAQIYLYCRLLRKPRRHAKVQRALIRLLWCLARMPSSGPLFSGQHAQFRVVIAAVVAYIPEHREQISDWFLGVLSGTRGNVPPVWRGIQSLWKWLDAHDQQEPVDDADDESFWDFDEDAQPWWEAMVAHVFEKEGRLNLA